MPRTARPNLLLITTDQQRWDALSYVGTPGYDTPNLDRLAEDGVIFKRAYSPSPVCTPARISMINGQYPTRHGGYQIGMSPVPALEGPTLAGELSKGGYATACIGKTHFVARALEEQHIAGTDEKPDENFWDHFDGPYLGFDFIRHNSGHTCNIPPDGHYRSWLKRQGKNLDQYHWTPGDTKAQGQGVDCGLWELNEYDSSTAWIAGEALEWIEDTRQSKKPWFAMVNFQDPHAPYICPDPYFSQVQMEKVTLPHYREGEFENKPSFYKSFFEQGQYLDEEGNSLQDSQRIASIFGPGFAQDQKAGTQAYMGMVNMIDNYVGKIVKYLMDTDQFKNTLIVFTSDHGDYLGNHGVWEKGAFAYDDCQRIPAIMHWQSGQEQALGTTESMFNLVDIMPTFLDAAGVPIPQGVQGKSQVPLLCGEADMVSDWALVDFAISEKLHQQTLVHKDFKLVVYKHTDDGELYDLQNDPDQYDNLYHREEFLQKKLAMLQKLARVNMEKAGKLGDRDYYA